jgi:hypothetical protein
MRRIRLLLAATTLALAVGAGGTAHGLTVDQVVKASIAPKKHPKKRFTNAKLFILTDGRTGENIPPAANRARVSFDNDIKFRPRSVPKCPRAAIAGQLTPAARAACRNALVGVGRATLYLGAPGTPKSTGVTIPVTVSAFNARVGGGPGIYLHSDPGFTPVTLEGRLVRSNRGRDFGRMLNVIVPPTGGSLGAFRVTVGRVLNKLSGSPKVVRGKYIGARCRDRNRRFNFHGVFNFDSTGGIYPTSAADRAFSRCRR